MKIIISLFLICLTCACGDNDLSEKTTGFQINQPEPDIESDTLVPDLQEVDPQPGEPKIVHIEDLGPVWLCLTENTDIEELESDEGYSIYKWCFAELPQLWFESGKGEDWYLSVLHGQDTEDYLISDFNATESEQELAIVVNGEFTLTSLLQEDLTKKVTFWWNKDIYFACFEGIYKHPMYYVPEENKGMYEEVYEICDEP